MFYHTKRSFACGEHNMYVFIYLYSCFSHSEHRASVKRFVSHQFLNRWQSIGLFGRGISPSQGRYLHGTIQTQNKRKQTSMPWVAFEPTIPVFQRTKIFHVLDRAAAVIDNLCVCYLENPRFPKGHCIIIGTLKQHPALDMEFQRNHDYLTFGYPTFLLCDFTHTFLKQWTLLFYRVYDFFIYESLVLL
jgi:hypothetical protein